MEEVAEAKRLKILVVGESRGQIVFSLLKDFECLQAESAPVAEKIFALGRNDIAVAVLCLRGLGSEALEFSRIVKKRSPTTKVIIITGFSALETTKTAVREGVCWGYLIRPFGLSELRDVVIQALNPRDEQKIEDSAREDTKEIKGKD